MPMSKRFLLHSPIGTDAFGRVCDAAVLVAPAGQLAYHIPWSWSEHASAHIAMIAGGLASRSAERRARLCTCVLVRVFECECVR